ncbi:uncharacterized protein LOC123260858 [Cotesia glomerata]|uniref:Spermatogenesis-associated protein 6 N-terminal domain-containing protein n=1 Tax=Cotesia glomerata TaxID=32391 RepID=A0AAV7IIC9_COTGL|nr:uncharacterized protein LOC123260858 [Cotesia glomerata]KAH0550662.1 hypothetical protein KQX54_020463 [Cotesia glomerata]
MTSKGFCVKIYFDLHIINCPGVWLCPNGTVALQINSLNSHIESRKVTPSFPLVLDEKFLFKKIFTEVGTLTELECCLEKEFFYAELIQWPSSEDKGVILATFETNLVDLLYPAPCYRGLMSGVDVDLLMEPTKFFPGIIAPKIEVSTRTVIEEIGICGVDVAKNHIINPKLINSKGRPCIHRKRPTEGILRQKKVCHTQGRIKSPTQLCACRHQEYRVNELVACPSATQSETHVNDCYQRSLRRNIKQTISYPCKDSILDCTPIQQFHDLDDCPVCSKYQNYFSKGSRTDATLRSTDSRKEASYGSCDVANCTEHSSESSISAIRKRVQSLNKEYKLLN